MNSLHTRESIRQSIAYERAERFSDVVPDHQIGGVVLFGGLVVDDDQFGAAVPGHMVPVRPDHQRRSDQEQVAMLRPWRGTVFRHACLNEMVAV